MASLVKQKVNFFRTSTGAGGAQSPYLVLRATSVLSCMMILSCYLGSIVSNKIGLKWTLILGTTGYSLYSAALYQNIRLAYRNSGSILGGCINLAFNATGSRTGKLDWRSYIVFVVLQCLGPAIGAFLTPPEKVQRTDGTKVQLATKLSTKAELKQLGQLSLDRRILLTIPLAFYAIFQLSWVGSFLTQYYSVRARALASLVAALVQILGNLLFGYFLDYQSLSLNKRAKYGFAGMMALHGGTWIWATIVQHDYETRVVKPAFDWSDPGFARGWVLYLFVQLCFSTIYNYAFWFIGGLARNSNEVVRFTSIIRSWESAGGAVASGIASTKTPLIAQVGVNFGLWAFCLPFSWILVRRIGLDENGNDISFFELNEAITGAADEVSRKGPSTPSVTDKDVELAEEDRAAANSRG
ncbi:hypothetical protein Rhopal_004827-T1 [Rhodotorula paludigena]|uniref:Uncharacterized protein n=1 Tax=Rhodotorula paludigena TaxID=86838 RepID=A0AAV5GRC9_9BASI|nr:hypothetical protein Rhopal_004827-T1 [Rhodotorula paludigena]